MVRLGAEADSYRLRGEPQSLHPIQSGTRTKICIAVDKFLAVTSRPNRHCSLQAPQDSY